MAVIAGAFVGPYGEAVEPAGVGGQLEVEAGRVAAGEHGPAAGLPVKLHPGHGCPA